MVWTFAAGGKLFVYQSSVLVVGYSYGYFRHTDMIKIGIFITLVEFVLARADGRAVVAAAGNRQPLTINFRGPPVLRVRGR